MFDGLFIRLHKLKRSLNGSHSSLPSTRVPLGIVEELSPHIAPNESEDAISYSSSSPGVSVAPVPVSTPAGVEDPIDDILSSKSKSCTNSCRCCYLVDELVASE